MRNYADKPISKKVELFNCPVSTCRKKYKREEKLKQHVEKDHYYETRNSNNFKFDHDIRAQIYDSAASYIVELYEIRKDKDYGEVFAKNLLPQSYGKDISLEDINRIMDAQYSFAKRLLDENLYSCDWNSVMDDLERFFNLGLPYYDTNFCPTLTIDFLWHAMMQKPDLYVEICKTSCKEVISHCNNHRTEDEDTKRYEYFMKVFQHKYNRLPCPFPSELEAFSISDIRGVFSKWSDRELNEAESKRLKQLNEATYKRLRDEKIKREEDEKITIMRQNYALKCEQEDNIIKNISEHLGIQITGWCERRFYLEGYKFGYRDTKLKEYAEREVKYERNKPSTC